MSRGYGRIASGIPSELDSTAREADATAFDARAGLVWWRPGSLADLGALGTPGSSRQLFGFSTQSAAEGEGKEKGEEETETSTAADQGAEENEAEAEEEAEAEGVSAEAHADLVAKCEALEATVAKMGGENADYKDKLIRTLADMENLRERTSRQVENSQKFAVQGFVKDLLDVSDNLERALQAVESDYLEQGGDGDLGEEEEAFGLLKSSHGHRHDGKADGVVLKNGVESSIRPGSPSTQPARGQVRGASTGQGPRHGGGGH